MMETAAQSAELKHQFKAHFHAFGYDAPLPEALAKMRDLYPLEWSEACQEFEQGEF